MAREISREEIQKRLRIATEKHRRRRDIENGSVSLPEGTDRQQAYNDASWEYAEAANWLVKHGISYRWNQQGEIVQLDEC